MALYAIGDIQGCHAEFCELLDLIAFSPASDRLWLVGDLVNRGPESLAVLREVRKLGDAATTVLGNHDFHLLTIAAGHRQPHREDTLDAILEAPDRDELIAWLKARPLVVVEDERLLVHAGLLPQWTPATALMLSREVQAMLGSERARNSWASCTATIRGNGATTTPDTTASASRSMPARGCVSAPPTARWTSAKSAAPITRPKASCRGSRTPRGRARA